jgi:hypothetical protein
MLYRKSYLRRDMLGRWVSALSTLGKRGMPLSTLDRRDHAFPSTLDRRDHTFPSMRDRRAEWYPDIPDNQSYMGSAKVQCIVIKI